MRSIGGYCLVVLLTALSGCATVVKMAPTKQSTALDTSRQSVLLVSMTLANTYHDSYQPEPLIVELEKPDATQSPDRLNVKVDRDALVEQENGKHYLLRLPLAPGKYILRGVMGESGIFPVHGFFFLPLNYDIDVKPGTIEYLGHFDAIVVERKDGELRAGPMIPLIDQAVTGFSRGTWDVRVTDASPTDVAEFKTAFPALQNATIQSDILPRWDKQKATLWWQEH